MSLLLKRDKRLAPIIRLWCDSYSECGSVVECQTGARRMLNSRHWPGLYQKLIFSDSYYLAVGSLPGPPPFLVARNEQLNWWPRQWRLLVFAMQEFPFPLFPVSRTFWATGIPVREFSHFPPKNDRKKGLKLLE